MGRLSNVRPVLLAFAGFTPRFEPSSLRAFEPSSLRASSLRAFEPSSFELRAFELRAFELRASSFELRASSFEPSGLRAFEPSSLRAFGPSSLRAFGPSGLLTSSFRLVGHVPISAAWGECSNKIENKVSRCSFFRLSCIRSGKSELLMKL
jgi:hypothetical protein